MEELNKMKEVVGVTMKWIHIRTIEVLIKATLKKGINSKINLSIMYKRINDSKEVYLGIMLGYIHVNLCFGTIFKILQTL
ncbi:hypothetical protein ACS0TY_015212 [Phlomoides rotata]